MGTVAVRVFGVVVVVDPGSRWESVVWIIR
jgi:hypothetical protein